MTIADLLDRLGTGVRYLGVALIVLGLLAMVAPVASGATVMVLVGLLLLLAGVVRAVFGWRAWSGGKGPLGVVVGGLTAACGLALVANPVSSLSGLTLLVAAYLVLDGASGILFALGLMPEDGWPWMLGDGLLSILLGASIWIGWPFSGTRAVGILIGIKLVSAGLVMIRVQQTIERLHARAAALRARLTRSS